VGKMGLVPSDCLPKCRHAALLVIHLDQPNIIPHALPGTIWAGNAAVLQALADPRMNSQILVLFLVLIADVSSALGVVYTRHQSRLLAVELGSLEAHQDEGLAEWSRLQIEQGWLADASQIEKKARGVLQMRQPAETQILVVRP